MDWTVCGASDAHRRQHEVVPRGTGSSPACTACHGIWKVASDEQLPDDRENCLHPRCAPTRCTVWSPSSEIYKKEGSGDRAREVRLSVVAFRGELLSFSSLSDLTAASRAQLALEHSTKATVVEEFHTFVIKWLPLSSEPKLLRWCF